MQNEANFIVCSVVFNHRFGCLFYVFNIFFMIYFHNWRLIFTDLKIEKESESQCISNDLSKHLKKLFFKKPWLASRNSGLLVASIELIQVQSNRSNLSQHHKKKCPQITGFSIKKSIFPVKFTTTWST